MAISPSTGLTDFVECALGYIYAVITSDAYRGRFEGALQDDFPRIPFASGPTDFEFLAPEGVALVRLHLLEEPDVPAVRLEGPGDLVVRDARYGAAAARLWINATQYLEPVSRAAWEAFVGGYAVLSLWLRNRRGRTLTRDEARDLARIVGSLEAAAARRPPSGQAARSTCHRRNVG